MGIKISFDAETNRECAGRGPEYAEAYFLNKARYWNDMHAARNDVIELPEILSDLGYNVTELRKRHPEIMGGYWDEGDIVFNVSFDQEGLFLLDFNCKTREIPEESKKKRCYFWRIYKYHVSVDQISLSGWVEWCEELFRLQHGKPRPRNNKIFVNPDMKEAIVKARVWNKGQIEKWLNDHGYRWTYTTEIKYQYAFKNADDVELVDSDAEEPGYAEKIRQVTGKQFVCFNASKTALKFAQSARSAEPIMKPFNPDQIVYCGPRVKFANCENCLNEIDANVIIMKGKGIYAIGDTQKAADNCMTLVKDAMKIATYAEAFGGAKPMDPALVSFIVGWEVESYRKSVSK